MRIFTSLLAGVGRRPQNEAAVPFQEMLPLKLKNSVSGKTDSQKEVRKSSFFSSGPRIHRPITIPTTGRLPPRDGRTLCLP